MRTWLHVCGVRGGQALHHLPLIDGASGSLLLALWCLVSRGPRGHVLCLALPWSFVKVPYIISELPRYNNIILCYHYTTVSLHHYRMCCITHELSLCLYNIFMCTHIYICMYMCCIRHEHRGAAEQGHQQVVARRTNASLDLDSIRFD